MYGSRSVVRTPSTAPSRRGPGGAPQAGHTLLKSSRLVPHSGQTDSVTFPPLALARALAPPPRAVAAHVDVGERAVPAAGLVDADAAHHRRVLGLHPVGGAGDHLRVGDVHAAVAVQIVHGPVP